MTIYTDQQIIDANNGKVFPGDYVVFNGPLQIEWKTMDVDRVNIYYEKQVGNSTSTVKIADNVESISNGVSKYIWNVNLPINKNVEYPLYRFKIVSSISNNIIAYSNYFKVAAKVLLPSVTITNLSV